MRQVTDNGFVYGSAVFRRRGWQRQGGLLLSDWTHQRPGGDTAVQNRKPAQAKGASYSVSRGGEGEKANLGAKL